MPLSMELLSLAAGGIFGALMKLWSQSQQDKHLQHLAMMDISKARHNAVQLARSYGAKDKSFSFTRRIIAISSVMAIIVLPKVLAAYCMITSSCGDNSVWVSSIETKGGFWFFTEPSEHTEWIRLSGMFVTPLDYQIVLAIVGMYFGGSIVKR